MICKNCGVDLQDPNLLICPHCGQDPLREPAVQIEDVLNYVPGPQAQPKSKPSVQLVPVARSQPVRETQPAARGMSGCAWGIVLLTLFACIAVAFVAAGLGGVYQGLQSRNIANQAQAYEHYSRGMVHMEAGETDLAEAEFEQAIRLSPSTSMDAYEKLKTIRAERRVQPTPTSAIIKQAGADILGQARVEYEMANWEEAIIKLEQVQSLDADYDPTEIENMLYTAYMKYGQQLLEEDRPEEARRSFESVLDFRPEDADALRQVKLVIDYLSAASLMGANWEEAIIAFTNLYRRDKDYMDVAVRLQESHRTYGELLTEDEDWCGAALQYAKALGLGDDADIRKAYDETGSQCETGPPPIEGPPSPLEEVPVEPQPEQTAEAAPEETAAPETEPVPTQEAAPAEEKPSPPPVEEATPEEGAPPVTEAPPPSGILAYSTFDPDNVRRISQIEVGKGTDPGVVVQNGSQPAFNHDGTKLAFLSWLPDANGIRVTDIGGRNGYNITKFLEDSYPSWGPDGTQMALSSTRENDRKPRVYTSWADGMVDSVDLGLGEQPSWSGDGWIVYHGCEPTGGNCGLWKMAPNGKGQSPLTNSDSDTAPDWSSDSSRIAFMSARDGNWEIYTVNADGSQPTRLTDNSADDGIPTWSPDNNWIAFVSSRGGMWSLYLVPAKGGEPQKLWDVPNIGRDWIQQRLSWR